MMLDTVSFAATSAFWIPLFQIIWIDLLLSGDNAVVIALACRGLPARQRRWGIALGAGAAIVLRVVLAVFIVYLLDIPYLKLIGAALLCWISIQLMLPGADHEDKVTPRSSLLGAVGTIVMADAVMSLDNVIAIAAASEGNVILLILGLLVSIPLIVFGSQIIIKAISHVPWLVVFGAGLLGWVAGEVVLTDPVLRPWADHMPSWLHLAAPVIGAAIVIVIGRFLARILANRPLGQEK